MKPTIKFLVVICILSISVFVGCTKKTEALPQLSSDIAKPYQEVIGTSFLYCYDSTRLLWKLKTEYSRRQLDDTSSTFISPVNLVIYDNPSNGSHETHVVSDSGSTGKTLDKFFIWGNVFIKNWDGLSIKTQSLSWNKRTHRVASDDFVEIRTKNGDVIRGKGLDATESFSSWTLRSKVSGEFPNFKNRVDKGGEF